MNDLLMIISGYLKPLSSPFYFIFLLLMLKEFYLKKVGRRTQILLFVIGTVLFFALYTLISRSIDAARWLEKTEWSFFLVIILEIIPAVFLPRNRWYKVFLIVPMVFFLLWGWEIIHQYSIAPDGGFFWLPARAEYFIPGFVGMLVIAQFFINLKTFRAVVRISVFLVLIYGGFALRENYTDYKDMLARRQTVVSSGVVNFSETVPVLKKDRQLFYLPSAPCRFSSDGGFVQGCVMELTQRILQLDWKKAYAGDTNTIASISMGLSALLVIIVFLFAGARWWCGWVCPLSTLGDIFNVIRRLFRLPHIKPSPQLKRGMLISGLLTGIFTLTLAKAFAFVDSNGNFLGCKIPLYPFCKICPGQQVCPVAARGPDGYPPLPGMEWLFGFFKIGAIALLVLFIVSFASARRLWCRFCPMGMFGGIFNRGGMFALKKKQSKCNGCAACREVCPMDIETVQKERTKEEISHFDCIYCMKCVDACPQNGCLSVEFCGKTTACSEFKIPRAKNNLLMTIMNIAGNARCFFTERKDEK
jgi:ferredoxin-type protein NapH